MSTIASPRPSLSLRSPSSSRTSLDIPQPQRGGNPRRNRAALRDYYNIKANEGPQAAPAKEELEISELDKDGFDPEGYVKDVLEKQGLEGVLKVEGGLVNDIRGLDGERKALVYDNYSKLIAATDTIRKMRTNMDPLTPATSTLAPAISHIAETATALSSELASRDSQVKEAVKIVTEEAMHKKERNDQRNTVRWILDAPRRLRESIAAGEHEAAEEDWEEVRQLLQQWGNVKGIAEVKEACEEALEELDTT